MHQMFWPQLIDTKFYALQTVKGQLRHDTPFKNPMHMNKSFGTKIEYLPEEVISLYKV